MNKIILQLKENKKSYYIIYSILFILIASFVFSFFYLTGKSFIWKKDGLFQHFNALTYYGEYLRECIKTRSMPLWDFKLGYGADIITTLHYYVLGDPLNLLAVFVPAEHVEWLYNVLILLRFYLAGISFSIYSRERGNSGFSTLAGSIIYTFCGYALLAGVRHPYFLNPMIYFPLLLLGIERIFAGKKPHLFISMVFVSAISNFYFFYMLSLLSVLYGAIRFFFVYQENILKNLWIQLRNFFLCYMSGLLMACIIFLPVVIAMFGGGRLQAKNAVPLFYDQEYYRFFLSGFVSPVWLGNWTVIGGTLVGLIAVIFMWFQKRRYTDFKILFCIMTLCLLLPMGGYILNGFSYVSNRWVWGYVFLIAYIVTLMVPHMESACKILFRRRRIYRYFKGALLCSIILGIFLNAFLRYSPLASNYVDEFREMDTAYDRLTDNETMAADVSNDTFHRYEQNHYGTEVNYNTSLQTGLNGTTFYFSVVDGTICNYFNEMNMNIVKSFSYDGLDGRAYAEALACVKYFIVQDKSQANLPYGFSNAVSTYTDSYGEKYHTFENQNVLPLGYTYMSSLDPKIFDTMSPIEKQQAMLQAVVMDDGKNTGKIEMLDQSMDYEIKLSEGVTKKENTFFVEKEGAVVTLTFDGIPNSENYLYFQNLHYAGNDTTSRINVSMSKAKKSFLVRTPENQWYEDTHDFLIQAGYAKGAQTELKLTFPQTGTYTFDQLEVLCLSMDKLPEYTKKLQQDTLESVVIKGNEVTGNITLDQEKTLCLSIPYSTGWKAYVDGKETKIHQANLMYMAIELDSGNHEIRLVYKTPGLNLGFILAFIGLGLFFVIRFCWKRSSIAQF